MYVQLYLLYKMQLKRSKVLNPLILRNQLIKTASLWTSLSHSMFNVPLLHCFLPSVISIKSTTQTTSATSLSTTKANHNIKSTLSSEKSKTSIVLLSRASISVLKLRLTKNNSEHNRNRRTLPWISKLKVKYHHKLA